MFPGEAELLTSSSPSQAQVAAGSGTPHRASLTSEEDELPMRELRWEGPWRAVAYPPGQ